MDGACLVRRRGNMRRVGIWGGDPCRARPKTGRGGLPVALIGSGGSIRWRCVLGYGLWAGELAPARSVALASCADGGGLWEDRGRGGGRYCGASVAYDGGGYDPALVRGAGLRPAVRPGPVIWSRRVICQVAGPDGERRQVWSQKRARCHQGCAGGARERAAPACALGGLAGAARL